MNDQMRNAIDNLKNTCTEENLWQAIIIFQNYPFYTASGLPFHYTLKRRTDKRTMGKSQGEQQKSGMEQRGACFSTCQTDF